MIIQFEGFKEGEVHKVDGEYDPKSLDLEFDDYIYSQPVKLTGTVEKGIDSLIFRGSIESEVKQTCGRCLEEENNPVKKDFEFYYEIKDKTEIDATSDIRELLVMDHPMVYICRRGQKSDCTPQYPRDEGWKGSKDKPFSSLKNFFDRSKKEK